MDLSDLRIFLAVADEGGVTPAARKLHRVQSNITTRIKQLEAGLGVALFHREGKRLTLNTAGRALVPYGRQLLSLAEEAERMVTSDELTGTLRIGAMDSTAIVRLPEPVTVFQKNFPAAQIELRTGNPTQLLDQLADNALDAALTAGDIPGQPYKSRAVFQEEIVIVTRKETPGSVCLDYPPDNLLVFESGCPHRKLLESWRAASGRPPAKVTELGSYHGILSCVIAGMGAALMPRSILTTFRERKRLSVHAPPKPYDQLTTSIVWKEGMESRLLREFIQLLPELSG